jgi:tRNA-uridine 2-sulfurtransferase
MFVISKDIKENIVYVGVGVNHPGLYKKYLFIKKNDIHWLNNNLTFKIGIGKKLKVKCRTRYKQPLQIATLYLVNNGVYIIYDKPQIAITEGQYAVWYIKEEIIGSGRIT